MLLLYMCIAVASCALAARYVAYLTACLYFLSFNYLDSPIVAFHAQFVFKFCRPAFCHWQLSGAVSAAFTSLFSNSRYPSPAACPPAVLSLSVTPASSTRVLTTV